MKYRHFHKTAVAAAFGLAALTGSVAQAADFPSDNIRLIVPYKPGGGTDTIARAFAAAMETQAGVPVLVENIPGSAGINGMMALVKSEPDGHTIAINGSSDVSGAVAFRDNPPFGLENLACAGGVFNTPAWMLSHKDNGFEDLGDFIEAARANPGKMTVGITGKLSPTDFVASTLAGTSDLDINIVNFGGGGPLKKAILANQVNMGVIISPVLMSDVVNGDLKVLAAAGDLSGISQEPLRGTRHMGDWNEDARIDIAVIRGIFLPSGVPDDVQEHLEELVHATVTSEAFTEFAVNFGFSPYTQSGADYCARLPQEVVDLTRVFDNFMQQ
ncbi:tripartite tricarboxylate transporter substrate binding protein [Fluviibacterium sp. DFM31]|uniref:Tripartite tricarboxylate transporter substrate binding protein n=1 Tax=Meridianimarinicoccus marinus TaxID=3231483 RepID=A0ABV3LCU9_9RHOB